LKKKGASPDKYRWERKVQEKLRKNWGPTKYKRRRNTKIC